MKTQSIIISSAVAGLIGFASFAALAADTVNSDVQKSYCKKGQHAKSHGHRGFKKVFAELNLTENQKAQLQQLRQKKNDGGITRETFRSELSGILTAEQYAKMEQIKSQRKTSRHSFGKKGIHGKMASLNLSDAQKTQMRDLRKERRTQGRENFDRETFMNKMQAILTPEQFTRFQEFKRR